MSGGGRFDFDDGGTYCGGWEDGKAHGYGICTGPKGQGEYSGAWQFGFEVSGVYTWPSGNCYEGQWTQGKRHGLGVETKGRWVYRGEWTQGFKGRYGSRHSTTSGAKYEGTWTTGLQDGYGVETYADGGTYDGQWLRGMRHGYGVRTSVPYGLASHYRPKTLRDSLTSLRSENEDDHVVKDRDRKINESRGGFVLQAKSDESPSTRRRSLFDKHGRSSLKSTLAKGLKLRKQKSTGDIQESPRRPTGGSVRSTVSNISHASADSAQSGVTSASVYTDSNASFVSQDDITDANVTECYMGEWKNDKRSGFGISERSDGLKYEGEWYNNKKYGYGVTTFKDGSKEEGKYKNNVLVSSGKKSKIFLLRSSKLRERIDNAVAAAQTASQIAQQKRDIAISRMANARSKAEQADMAARKAREDSDQARLKAKEYAPEFHQPGTDILKKRLQEQGAGGMLPNTAAIPNDYSSLKPLHNHVTQRAASVSMTSPGGTSPGPGEAPPGATPDIMDGMIPSSVSPDYHRTTANTMHAAVPSRDMSIPLPNHHQQQQQQQHYQPQLQQQQQQQQHEAAYGRDNRLDSRIRPQYSQPQQSAVPRSERFSELLNSTIVSDHFDQYRTIRDNDGLVGVGGGGMSPDYGSTPSPQPDAAYTVAGADGSPDSGVDTEEVYSKARPLLRRKTLPSIVKREPALNPAGGAAGGDAARSQQNLSREQGDTYVIENGIRKRVKAEVYAAQRQGAGPARSNDDLERPKELPKRYRLESPSRLRRATGDRGSLPDVSACKELQKAVMPRAQVSILSEKRRRELMKQEEEERKKQQEIVLRLGDVKEWCQQRQLVMLVIAVNVSLATMFFNLLSQ